MTLGLVRAGGPWGRARGLLAQPTLLDGAPPSGLWLGRTPQVHTFNLPFQIAVVTADVERRGARPGRPCALRVRRVDVLDPGVLGRWSWNSPVTVEVSPATAQRLAIAPGAVLELEW